MCVRVVDDNVPIKAPIIDEKKFFLLFQALLSAKKNYVILAAAVYSRNFTWSKSGEQKISAHV